MSSLVLEYIDIELHNSQRVIPVFGSLIAGSRPLGLMSVKDRSLTSENSTNFMIYGIKSSSRTIHTFLCLVFISWSYQVGGLAQLTRDLELPNDPRLSMDLWLCRT
jgi:hypothetical protein